MLSSIALSKVFSSTLIIGSFIGAGVYALNNLLIKRKISKLEKENLIDNHNLAEDNLLDNKNSEENLPILEEKTIENQDNEVRNNTQSIDIPKKEELVVGIISKELESSNIPTPLIDNESEKKEITKQRREESQLEVIWIYGDSPGTSSKRKSCFSLKKGEEKVIPNIMEVSDSSSEDEEERSCERIIEAEDKNISGDQEGLWINGNYGKVKEMINSNLEDLKLSGFIKKSRKNNFSISERFNNYLESHCQLKEYGRNWIEISCLKAVKNVRNL